MFPIVFVASFDSNIALVPVVVCKIENQQDRGGGRVCWSRLKGGWKGGAGQEGGWRTKVILLGLY